MNRFIVHRSSFIVFLLAACASSAPPPPPAPPITTLPSAVVDAMCVRLHDEGYASDQTVNVVTKTQPLITQESLEALAQMEFYKGRVNREALQDAAEANAASLPIARGTGGCAWRGVDAGTPRRSDTMQLELSAPFTMPFGHGGKGVLARFSLGGEAASWFWIPIAYRNGVWVAARATPLVLH